jgi:NitT/TauT family transport system ATP-binding protein
MGFAIDVKGISHTFGEGKSESLVLKDISFSMSPGEFVAIVGPSGCGKTTLLNLISGLEPIQVGSIEVDGIGPKAGREDTSYVFAEAALLPWRTTVANVEIGVRGKGVSAREKTERSLGMLETVGLAKYANSYRSQLSQGMRQRVALARSLVGNPELLFMDEPFAALDAQTRIVMQDELSRLIRPRNASVILITHDLAEGVALADRVMVMSILPGTFIADVKVDFPRPRSSIALREDRRFNDLVAELWSYMKTELNDQVEHKGRAESAVSE